MLCRPTSLPQHPCPYVGRTVQDRDAGGLALVEKTDALDLHEIDLVQIEHHSSTTPPDFNLQLIEMLKSKLSAQSKPRSASTRDPFDLQRHELWPAAHSLQVQALGQQQPPLEAQFRERGSPQFSGIPVE